MSPDECIFFQLAKTYQASMQYWSAEIAHLELTAVQAMVLNFLGRKDAVTSRSLGERAGLDSATLSGVLDRLEKLGLLSRRPHPEDRRAVLVCLTEEGKALSTRVHRAMRKANVEFLARLSAKEQATLRSLLLRVRLGESASE